MCFSHQRKKSRKSALSDLMTIPITSYAIMRSGNIIYGNTAAATTIGRQVIHSDLWIPQAKLHFDKTFQALSRVKPFTTFQSKKSEV